MAAHSKLNRFLAFAMLGFGVVYVADWIYVGLSDEFKLVRAAGYFLVGSSLLFQAGVPGRQLPRVPHRLLQLAAIVGLALLAWAFAHAWLSP